MSIPQITIFIGLWLPFPNGWCAGAVISLVSRWPRERLSWSVGKWSKQ